MSAVRKILRDDQWQKLAPLLPGKAGDKGRSGQDNRMPNLLSTNAGNRQFGTINQKSIS